MHPRKLRTEFFLLLRSVYSGLYVVFLLSCKSEKEPFVAMLYYEDGSLMVEQYFSADSIANGLYRKYYGTGKLMIEAFYSNGEQEGMEKGYYESGALKYSIKFVDGLKRDTATWYYENGVKSSIAYYENGIAVKEGVDFYPNGEPKKYTCSDFTGLVRFQIDYDENGNELNRLGSGVVYVEHNGLDHLVGDTLSLSVLIAIPPGCTSYATLTTNPGKQNQTVENLKIDNDNWIRYSRLLNQAGEFDFVGTYNLILKDGSKMPYNFAGKYYVKQESLK